MMVKRVLFSLVMVVSLGGCCSVPEDVADSIDVLRDNTRSLSTSYEALLQRAGPPALPVGPAEETAAEKERRQAAHDAAWRRHVAHKRALMEANNTLADRVQTWAAICAGRQQGATDDPDSE